MKRYIVLAVLVAAAFPAWAAQDTIGVSEGADANVATESRTWNAVTGQFEAIVNWPSNVTSMGTNQVSIAVTDTAVRIFSDATSCRAAIIKANCTNSANPFVVGISTVTTTTGFRLWPCDMVTLEPPDGDDCGDIYVNGTSGDGASVIRK